MGKREKLSTPTKTADPPEPEPQQKRTFTGETAMDDEKSAWPSPAEALDERAQRRAERAAKKDDITIRAEKAKAAAEEKAAASSGQARGRSSLERAVNNGKSTRRSRSGIRSKSTTRRSKSTTRRSVSQPRRRSVSAKHKSSLKQSSRRSGSVDTGQNSRGSDESNSSKRKAESAPMDTDQQEAPEPKSATFADGTLNNEGKTRTTKEKVKEVKAAKKGKTYASKVKAEEKKNWSYRTFIYYNMKISKCANTCAEIYKRQGEAFRILQFGDPVCAIADHINEKAAPLRSPGDFPKPTVGSHARYQRYYT